MTKLRKDKRTGYYKAAVTTPSGTKYISTKCTDLKEARKVVRESGIEDLSAAGKAGRLTAQAIGYITTGKKLTVNQAIDRYEEKLLKRGRSRKTVHNNAGTVRQWASEMDVGSMPPAMIREDHIDPWVNDPKGQSKASSRRVGLSAIRSFFDFCSDSGWSPGNPARLTDVRYDVLSHAQKESKKVASITEQDMGRIRSVIGDQLDTLEKDLEEDRRQLMDIPNQKLAKGRAESKSRMLKNRIRKLEEDRKYWLFWHLAVMFGRECGLRLGDIASLEWASFEKKGHVIVWTSKRRRRVAFEVRKGLLDELSRVDVEDPKYVFPDQAATNADPVKRSHLSVYFGRILKKAGVKGKSFHGLRHARIKELKSQGKTLEEIAVEVGHASTETTAGYGNH